MDKPAASTGHFRDIARKAVHGSLYSGSSAVITAALGMLRLILLARWVLPVHFGAFALALFYKVLTNRLFRFGFHQAMLNNQGPPEAIRPTYFSLCMAVGGIKLVLLLATAPLLQWLYPEVLHLSQLMVIFAGIALVETLNFVQEYTLRRHLKFDIIARIEVISLTAATILAPLAAWAGWGLWALMVEAAVISFARFLLFWGPYKEWRPQFGWSPGVAREFVKFGKPFWLAINLSYLLDRFDDFWIGTFLGQTPLGYYSKAYDFSKTPRRVLGMPASNVFSSIFARLQQTPRQLSETFFQAQFLIIRLCLLISGLFFLLMPEFIDHVIGKNWEPMLWTFRLLIIYIILDTPKTLIDTLLNAAGKPEAIRNAAIVQLIFFIPAVIGFASIAGINGVALAADLMLAIGLWRRFKPLRETVDFSLSKLAGWPLAALLAATCGGLYLERSFAMPPLMNVLSKSGVFILMFIGILAGVEHAKYRSFIQNAI